MERPQRTVVTIIASLVILGSLVSLWLMFRPHPVKYDRSPIIALATGLGEVLAEETVQAVHDHGRIVLVNDYYRTQGIGEEYDYAATFQRELKKHANISLVATETVRPIPGEGRWTSCPVTVFKDLLERYAQTDAIVFLIDPPDWDIAHALIPSAVKAKIIVVDNSAPTVGSLGVPAKTRYGSYFSSDLLSLLISPKKTTAAPSTAPRTPREWFDSRYQVYTPANYTTLPEYNPVQTTNHPQSP